MKARILVIEDEMAINDLLCMNLEAAKKALAIAN